MTEALAPSSLLLPMFSTVAMRAVVDDGARVQRMLDFAAALARAEAAVGVIQHEASTRSPPPPRSSATPRPS